MPILLLATKLHIPSLRLDFVPRRRLLDRLETGLHGKLTLVSAPAGYGKATLLSEWHASARGRALFLAWVLLDEQDNDPIRFWSYVLAALERACPGPSFRTGPSGTAVGAGGTQSGRLGGHGANCSQDPGQQ